MLKVNCSAKDTAKLQDLAPFQGGLKKRKAEDIEQLAASLLEEGMMMPFAVWSSPDGKLNLLDGHGRLEALIKLSFKDMDILTQEFPIIKVDAETEEAARKALLQITSSYGKVDKKGLQLFIQKIPDYTAPVVLKAKPKVVRNKLKKPDGMARLVLYVQADKLDDLKKILSETPYVSVAEA